jgi:hypothetical protein
VDKYALVLGVGSGGNPCFRSNVVLDVYAETCKRHWMPLVSGERVCDRLIVLIKRTVGHTPNF